MVTAQSQVSLLSLLALLASQHCIQVPAMGPHIRKTQAYHDVILCLNEDNEDGETCGTCPQAKRDRGKATKPQTKVAPPKISTPMLPTERDRLQNRQAREKRREDLLVHNREERDAHNMDVFFPDVTDVIALGTVHFKLHDLQANLLYQSFLELRLQFMSQSHPRIS